MAWDWKRHSCNVECALVLLPNHGPSFTAVHLIKHLGFIIRWPWFNPELTKQYSITIPTALVWGSLWLIKWDNGIEIYVGLPEKWCSDLKYHAIIWKYIYSWLRLHCIYHLVVDFFPEPEELYTEWKVLCRIIASQTFVPQMSVKLMYLVVWSVW